MKYADDIRDIIGNTPLLKLNHISPDRDVNIFAKLEYLNPGGSIKDRIGLQIIENAERDGLIKPGSTIIEATAGNTGIGLALAAFEKGYRLIIVIPEKFSVEKQILMKALGAELIITPSEDGNKLEGIEGAKKLINAQLRGIKKVADLGIIVKINSVLIPGINDNHIKDIARVTSELGASILNIIPLKLRKILLEKNNELIEMNSEQC